MDIASVYINVHVSDFERSLDFYRDVLGLELLMTDESFGYASFKAANVQFAIVKSDPSQVGGHTGIGLLVKDLDAAHAELAEQVTFTQPPTKQPWGGYMALFVDPDGNEFYLDQEMPH